MTFPKFHGIALAANSWISNAVVENLAADPTPLGAGRIWYNTSDKSLKFSSLDTGGAITVQVVATGADVAAAVAAIAALGARVTAVEGSYIKKDGSVAFTGDVDAGGHKLSNVANGTVVSDGVNLGQLQSAIASLANAFDYIGTAAGGADVGSALDVTTLSSTKVGAYYKVSAGGYFKVGAAGAPFFANQNDGLVFNKTAGVDIIDNTDSNVAGSAGFIAVTGSADTGFTVDIDAAFKSRVSTAESGLAAEISRATAAEGVIDGKVAAEVARATGAENVLTTAIATEKTRAEGVEATLTAGLASEVSRAQAAEGVLDGKIATEKTRAEGVEAGLQTALDAEVARATAAEGVLTTAVATEKTRAEGIEAGLRTDLTAEAARAAAAEGVLTTDLAAEVSRATAAEGVLSGKVGNLSSLTTSAKTDLVSAINQVAAAAGTGTGALKDAINAQRFTYTAPSAALSHVISHNLNTGFAAVQVLTKGDDGLFRNDIVAVEETSANIITITLTEARIVKVAIQALDALA